MSMFIAVDSEDRIAGVYSGNKTKSLKPKGGRFVDVPAHFAGSKGRYLSEFDDDWQPLSKQKQYEQGTLSNEERRRHEVESAHETLAMIDQRSIRAIREWIASRPDAPEELVRLEAAAVEQREIIRKTE